MRKKERNDFIAVEQVVLIHLQRYNAQIQRLLAVEDYSDADLLSKLISRQEYYKARERRIKAYSDCINTMIQKEKILQYHNSGFEFEIIEEKKIEIKNNNPNYRIDILSFEQQLELYELIKKTKQNLNMMLQPISVFSEQNQVEAIESKTLKGGLNIVAIKHEQLPALSVRTLINSNDPTIKLRESLQKLAAKKFKEVGATLTTEEESYLEKL